MRHPSVAEVAPHSGPMCLLHEVVSHEPEETVCTVRVADSSLFAGADGTVPIWVGVEYMAQCIAVHAGLLARTRGEPPQPGLFLGSRRLAFRTQDLAGDRELLVSARHFRGSGTGLQVFSCALRPEADATPWIEGRLNVMLLDRIDDVALLRRRVP